MFRRSVFAQPRKISIRSELRPRRRKKCGLSSSRSSHHLLRPERKQYSEKRVSILPSFLFEEKGSFLPYVCESQGEKRTQMHERRQKIALLFSVNRRKWTLGFFFFLSLPFGNVFRRRIFLMNDQSNGAFVTPGFSNPLLLLDSLVFCVLLLYSVVLQEREEDETRWHAQRHSRPGQVGVICLCATGTGTKEYAKKRSNTYLE